MRFTAKDVGCYADGANGHEHTRKRLADLIWDWADVELRESLDGPMPDDAWDEEEALDLLNSRRCDEGVCFYFDSGDLILGPVDEEC